MDENIGGDVPLDQLITNEEGGQVNIHQSTVLSIVPLFQGEVWAGRGESIGGDAAMNHLLGNTQNNDIDVLDGKKCKSMMS